MYTSKFISLFNKNKKWRDYEPETIWKEMDAKFSSLPKGLPEFPRATKDAIMAIKLCFNNVSAWEEWHIFEKVILALNGKEAMFDIVQRPMLQEICMAVVMMDKIREADFSLEVQAYIASVAKSEGFIVMPSMVSFAQDELNMMSYIEDGDMLRVRATYSALKNKKTIKMSNDDSVGMVQCIKLMSIDSYIKGK